MTLTKPIQTHDGRRRILWIVNHKTLMPAEVPLLLSLGWKVFVPKIVPDHDPTYRSPAITYEYDRDLGLSAATLAVLNGHNFYERAWSPTVTRVLNDGFGVLVSSFSYYTTPLSEAARKFQGLIVARAFGREHPRTYAELAATGGRPQLLDELAGVSHRFVFAQAYGNLVEVEPPVFQARAHTITVPLPPPVFRRRDTWTGGGTRAVFLCPAASEGYYRNIYIRIKRDFGQTPHVIIGRQVSAMDDPAILPYLNEDELLDLYANAPVFVYPHSEPRHLHYSPLEAMVVGTPVLYLRGAMIDTLVGAAAHPGACASTSEMREKANRLIAGDTGLANDIRATQDHVLASFSSDVARRQWAAVLDDPRLSVAPARRNAA